MNYGMNDVQMRSGDKDERRNKSKTRGEEDDEAINVNDVQFEHQVDYDDDEGDMQDAYGGGNGGYGRANPQSYSGVSGIGQPNSGISGKANRIGAYRKSNTYEVMQVAGEQSTERRRRTHVNVGKSPGGTQAQDFDLDESFNNQGETSPDIKMAVENLKETQQVVTVVNQIESHFCKAKTKINGLDLITLESDITAQTLTTCYLVINNSIQPENPNFDSEKMNTRLDQMLQRVRASNNEYNKFKGDFFTVNEPIINKDTLTLNLDRAERYLEKQEIVLNKLPPQDELVRENASQISILKKKYQTFECQLFSKQVEETRFVIKDTEDLIEKVEIQEENLKNLVDQATKNLNKVQPQSKEQRQKFQKIQQDLTQVEQKIDDSIYDLNQELKNKDDLDGRHEESEKILGQIGPQDLTEMVGQSREMKKIVETHKKWVELYRRLKQMQDEEINNLEFFIQKAIQNAKKFQESVNSEKKDEYDEIMKKIQKLAKKVMDDGEEQSARLESFESKVVKPQSLNPHIADVDMIFLKKEISRNRSALEVSRNMADDILEDAQAVRDGNQKGSERNVSVNELHQLRENFKALQKIDSVDNPRIKRNIDMLEGFSVKSLKNQLNDDNKKSQAMISQMKKNFEDLQRQIEKLNGKVVTCSQSIVNLKNNFGNDDLERENEFLRQLDDKLETCNNDINGDRSESKRGESSERNPDDRQNGKQKSLQARKRGIIALINKMVNQFNENNKLIKEANKVAKNEKEMSELIIRNREIQEDCNQIAEQIDLGKVFSIDINERMENLIEPNLANLRDKYTNKNGVIDECDEVFDQASATIANQEGVITEELEKMKQIISRLDTVNPVNNPTVPGKDNAKFYKELGPKLDLAYKLQDQLEGMKDDLGKSHNSLINVVEPLNELGERQVKKVEIDEILKKLNNMNKDLNQLERDILPRKQDIQSLMGDVENMLERDKGRKVDEAEQLMNELDDQIDDLASKRDELYKKLNMYKGLINDAKGKEGREDPELLAKLRDLDAEAKTLEREINDVDAKMNDLKKKRNDSRRLLDEIKKQPAKYTPSQIDQLLMTLGDSEEKQVTLNDKADQQEDDLDQRLNDLNALLNSSQRRRQLQTDIDAFTKQMQDAFVSFQDVLEKTPKQIDQMVKTLQEMKSGSEPDESADYWEERKTIEQHLIALKKVKQKLDQLAKVCSKKKAEFDQLQASSKKAFEIKDLDAYAKDLKQAAVDLSAQLNGAYDCRDEVNDIKKEMADCEVPVNIQVRRNELQAYMERLDRIKNDFRDLKQADEDFDGEQGSEKEIKALIRQIEQSLRSYDQEGKDMQKYQNSKLDMYTETHFFSYTIYLIIIEVREFKFRIYTSTQKLKDLEDLINDLNSRLIQQDMDNATVLLTKKAQKLRDRLIAAQKGLKKIHRCGDDMDGNTTHNEEDEFIDALKDEMPDVFKNIDLNFEQIDGIDILLKQVIETRNIEKMALLKKEIDDANNKVEQSEGLVVKLENEIVEWNAFKKLCRRDEELAEIDALLKDFSEDLQEELQLMDKELQKNNAKMEKDGDPKGTLTQQRNGLINYMDEIEELMKFIIQLKDEKDICFKEFNEDLPRMVKEARLKRQQISSGMGSPNSRKPTKSNIGKGIDMTATESDKPNDIYYMITINCRYRKRIHELLKELRNINQRRRELEDKYAALKRDLSAIKATKAYKPTKGDPIDELFAFHLNKCGCTLTVKRLAPGKYLFGTRQILAKIINGKLVIRVGGGYMSAEEFIEQYGRQEMMKMMKNDEQGKSADGLSGRNAGQGKMDGKSAAGIGDMRDMMRNQLMNVKLYEGQGSADNLIGTTNRRSNVRGTQKVSLQELEGSYKMTTITHTKQGMSPAPQRSKIEMGSPKRERGYMNRTTSNDNFQRVSSPNIRR